MIEPTDLQLANIFSSLLDGDIYEQPCVYTGDPPCEDILDSDTCDPCLARLASRELQARIQVEKSRSHG